MSRIRILPEILSNKIAAGEVVERPASVVKELVENAIDAESTRIRIEIGQGGRSLIQVSDNGLGMSHDDALLCLERYATSKIYKNEDLYAISTLGFRGEALPSIAAVSRLTLITKERGSISGTRIQVEGGKIVKVIETGAPEGTLISARSLFFNTPARRKFLKTVNTEMAHIAEIVACMAMARPDIQFELLHNQKTVKTWPRTDSAQERIIDILGGGPAASLHPLEHHAGEIFISGFAASPSLTQATSQKIYVFVNGRFVKDRGIAYALFEGYRGRIMKGRFPVAAVFVRLPPEKVDVNVHPTKHQVRFAEPGRVYEAVRTAVSHAWGSPEPTRHRPVQTPVYEVQEQRPLPFFASSAPVYRKPEKTEEFVPESAAALKASTPPISSPEQIRFGDLSVIGQFHNTYILCESNDILILIDQHAAHERIVYERLKSHQQNNSFAEVQKLILPETFELGYKESAALLEILPDLHALGLEIEHFGGNTFVAKSVPSLIAQREVKPLITEIAEMKIAVGNSSGLSKTLDQCLILMACHGAIRAHQRLSTQEIRELLAQLDQCENPFFCPHGRPTFVRWPLHDLEKSFKRTV